MRCEHRWNDGGRRCSLCGEDVTVALAERAVDEAEEELADAVWTDEERARVWRLVMDGLAPDAAIEATVPDRPVGAIEEEDGTVVCTLTARGATSSATLHPGRTYYFRPALARDRAPIVFDLKTGTLTARGRGWVLTLKIGGLEP